MAGKSVDVDYHTNEEARETDIKFTFEKRLYMYERHTYEQMTYSLPVKPGKVTIILKFAEVCLPLFRCTSATQEKESST